MLLVVGCRLLPDGCVACLQAWVGKVSQIIPPNYGIVDDDAFYVHDVVNGRLPVVSTVMSAAPLATLPHWAPRRRRVLRARGLRRRCPPSRPGGLMGCFSERRLASR
jgi:hypothetical protein